MSSRIGIDLVSVGEVEEAIAVHGERYLTRVYSAGELRDCGGRPERLAARFAAKEATIKAIGRVDEGLDWRSIAVVRGPSGETSIELQGEAARLAQRRGVRSLVVSLTHERDHAAAVVVAEVPA